MEEKAAFNQFFHDFISKKALLMEGESEALKLLDHRLTKGVMREYSLMNFLSDFIPMPFKLGKGIVSDCTGTQSPEIDLIIYNENLLPPVIISDSLGVFPFETVRYFFEVKSSVDNASIADFSGKIKRFSTLVPLLNYGPNYLTPPLPVFFGYSQR